MSFSTDFSTHDYDLEATLTSGQSFRWKKIGHRWVGIVGHRVVRLECFASRILAESGSPPGDWGWLRHYLQTDVDLAAIIGSFPKDKPMQHAVASCRGLRLLRQDYWECLASFILSSTKQIVQIQQIIGLLCERYGEPLPGLDNVPVAFSFPAPERLAQIPEADLRECKMGFRAPYLRNTAKMICEEGLDLSALQSLSVDEARHRLLKFPGVGRKVADCVLLFAYGFESAFPVDVWVLKALRQLYFRRRRVNLQRLHRFAASHFGPHAGYAQQYLFHYMRVTGPASAALPDS